MILTPPWSSLVAAGAPDYDADPLTLAYVRDEHLRSPNGTAEDAYIEKLIRVSLAAGQHRTGRVFLTQTWTLTLAQFGAGVITLPLTPIQSLSLAYVDENGATQPYGGSPLPFVFKNPTAESNRFATIYPFYGESWPTTETGYDAVTLTIVAGFPEVNGICQIPEDINQGRLLLIGELYKQRSESVHAINQNPAVRGANSLWDNWKVR